MATENSSDHDGKEANVSHGFNVLRREGYHARCLGGQMRESVQGAFQYTPISAARPDVCIEDLIYHRRKYEWLIEEI